MPISTEQRDRLRRYLTAKMEGPQYEDETASANNLGAALMKSAAQVGSIGGRVADASPVDEFAKAQNAMIGQRAQGELRNMTAAADMEQAGNKEYLDSERTRVAEGKVEADAVRAQAENDRKSRHDADTLAETIRSNKAKEGNDRTKALADAVPKPKEDKPPTDAHLNAAGFARKALDADGEANQIEKGGYDPTSAKRLGQKIPVLGNYMASPHDQMYENAQKRFIAAILRKESGGAITDEEWASYGPMYFPRPGDSRESVAQKAQARAGAISDLKMQAGPAEGKVQSMAYTVPQQKQSGTAMAAPAAAPAKQRVQITPDPNVRYVDGVKMKKVQGGWAPAE